MKTHTSQYFVYIMSNFYNTVLYIGFTNDLMRRVAEHKQGATDGFTQKYNCHKLVYAEVYDTPEEAMRREKQLKKWNRAWKEALIDQKNKERIDLSMDWESLHEILF
ncbi:MAG: GIY-YIG nuclease family protein [Tannerellaceae bacterium]|nr:GIY-YIG nuclease family protein [Tannerellaceae bacterium]